MCVVWQEWQQERGVGGARVMWHEGVADGAWRGSVGPTQSLGLRTPKMTRNPQV